MQPLRRLAAVASIYPRGEDTMKFIGALLDKMFSKEFRAKPWYRQLIQASLFTSFMGGMILGITLMVMSMAHDNSPAVKQRMAQLSAANPDSVLHLSDYFTLHKLTFTSDIPVKIGSPVVGTEGQISGGGFQILGTGNIDVKSDLAVREYFPVIATLDGQGYRFVVPASAIHDVAGNGTAVMHLPNVVIDMGYANINCYPPMFHPFSVTCDPVGDYKLDPATYDWSEYDKLGITGLLVKYGSSIAAPAGTVPQ